jgi:hypothetical protein
MPPRKVAQNKRKMDEIQALQNFADKLNMKVRNQFVDDKRRTIKKYFLVRADGLCISPVLDYENLNHFMLGWNNCLKYGATQ